MTNMIDLIGQNCSAKLGIPIIKSNLVDVTRLTDSTKKVDITSSNRTKCPPWFIGDENRRLCRTGPDLGGIVYQDKETLQTASGVQLYDCHPQTTAH